MNYLQKKKMAFMSVVNAVKGFIKTISGVFPLSLTNCVSGDDIVDYKIYGNSTQDGTPTPETPIEIQSVGDLVTDETSEYYGKYDIPIIVRGKNLFNINDYRNKQNVSIVGNKITISNMNYVSAKNPSILKFLKPNTKYTISAKQWSLDSGTTSNTTFRVAVYEGSGASKTHYFTYGGNATKATPSDISGYTHMAIYSAKNGVISIEDLQIEEASSKTEYEPYHEPITIHIYLNEPLRKIGDYADYIDFKNKKVVRNVVQGVLDGSEPWAPSGTRYYYYNTKLNVKCLGTSVAGIKSNALPSKSWTEIRNSGTGIATYTNGTLHNRIDIRADGVWTSVDEAKAYLKAHPISYIAPMLNPEEEEIDLSMIEVDKGTNIIDIDTVIKPSHAEITYYSTVKGG